MTPRNVRRISVVLVCLLGLCALAHKAGIASPSAVLAATPQPIKQTFTVPRFRECQVTLAYPQVMSPGWVRGRWVAQGASDSIKGATDDTLVSFTVTGPNNEVIQHLDHPASGNFAFRYQGGQYTLTFSNAGVIRLSDRTVTLDGTYQPD
jgi:hypothetical protein